MEDHVKHLIPEYPHLGKRRTDSVNRQARDIMVDDIIEMFRAVDNSSLPGGVPVFVAVDVSKLPPSGPEAAGSLMSLMESLAVQQRQITQMQETMSSIRIDVDKNRADIGTMSPNKRNEPSAMETEKEGDKSVIAVTDGDDTSIDTEQPSRDDTYAQAVGRQTLVAGGQFQNGKKRPDKGKDKGKFKGSRSEKVGGTAESSILTAGPKDFYVQITNVYNEIDEDNIKDYISGKADDITVLNVEDTTTEGWSTKRFLIRMEYKHMDRVMTPEFWPKNIYYKRWFPRRSRNTEVN